MNNDTRKNKEWKPEVTRDDLDRRMDEIRELFNTFKQEYYGYNDDEIANHCIDAEKEGAYAEPERDYANEEACPEPVEEEVL